MSPAAPLVERPQFIQQRRCRQGELFALTVQISTFLKCAESLREIRGFPRFDAMEPIRLVWRVLARKINIAG